MEWKPKRWVAMTLSIFGWQLGLGLFYAGAPWLALLSVAATWGVMSTLYFGGPAWVFALSFIAVFTAVVAATYWTTRKTAALKPRRWFSRWWGLLFLCGAYWSLVFIVRGFFYEPFRAPSSSMSPSIRPGSVLVVQKWGYGHYGTFGFLLLSRPISSPLERGDIVVFDHPKDPSQTWIKRLIGKPGDSIVYRDKRVTLNGTVLPHASLDDIADEYDLTINRHVLESNGAVQYSVQYRDPPPLEPPMAFVVPPGHYFVLGDNRDNSVDSRMFGFVPARNILGKVKGAPVVLQ